MRRLMIALLMLSAAAPSHAFVKPYRIAYDVPIIEDGRSYAESHTGSFSFQMDLIQDDGTVKQTSDRNGLPFVAAKKGESYSIRLTNPLPVRVAVNLTVDGLNSVTGKPSGLDDGVKWIIDPYSSITIRGWQINEQESRRFFFTDKKKSYAKWRGDKLGQNLVENCGVIGAAFFWNEAELQAYYNQYPVYRSSKPCKKDFLGFGRKRMSDKCMPQAAAAEEKAEADFKAGTGMGARESHAVQSVEFHYDRGMYQAADALVIYYDFEPVKRPNPFPGMAFAPDCHCTKSDQTCVNVALSTKHPDQFQFKIRLCTGLFQAKNEISSQQKQNYE